MKKLVKESLQEYLNEEEVFKGQIETGLSIDDVDKKEFFSSNIILSVGF